MHPVSKITLSSHVQTAESWTGVEHSATSFFFLLDPYEFAQIKQNDKALFKNKGRVVDVIVAKKFSPTIIPRLPPKKF